MIKYVLLSAPILFISAAIADVPMIMIVDGTKEDTEKVIAVATSSISNVNNPDQAHKEIFGQEGGTEKVREYFENLGNKVRNKKPETSISLKYKAIYDHLDKQRDLAHRHRFHSNNSMNEKLKKEFLEKLRQERSKYANLEYAENKARITEYYKDSEAILHNSKLVEYMRPSVQNIDEIRDSFYIYTCAPYVGRLSREILYDDVYTEMAGVPYKVFGLNQIEKNLLASPDQNSAFKYASYILYDEMTPTMPSYKFWDKLSNYQALVKTYVNYLSIEEVKLFNDNYCKRYAQIVGE